MNIKYTPKEKKNIVSLKIKIKKNQFEKTFSMKKVMILYTIYITSLIFHNSKYPSFLSFFPFFNDSRYLYNPAEKTLWYLFSASISTYLTVSSHYSVIPRLHSANALWYHT